MKAGSRSSERTAIAGDLVAALDPGPPSPGLQLPRPFLGVHFLTYGATWDAVVAGATALDALGYDALLTQDHLFATQGDPGQPFFEAWTTIAALAPLTARIRLGHLTGAAPFRNAGLLARMLTTLDHVSNGRAMLGLGAAWDERELVAHDLPTDGGLGGRLDRLDEVLAIVRRLTAGEAVTRATPFHRFEGVQHNPLPIQQRVPVIMGSAGIRKGLRVVARHADLWQTWIEPGGVEAFRLLGAALDGHCRSIGRDPASVHRVPGFKMIIRDSHAEAQVVVDELAAFHRWTPEVRAYIEPIFWRGTVDWFVEHLEPFVASGIDGFVVQAAAPYDLASFERFRAEVVPVLWPRA